ncbi:amino acid transporter [Sporormia fimetaria CBS 119925]|uniref:Amino acid transporter n=1 Tax=Sporormia fimetaria CBS 119925 TaxID=1340428 RepID=A0A6A6V562_9PLEO|nr:amino acid transporter [Sporormia fimetaria CBS 119925]
MADKSNVSMEVEDVDTPQHGETVTGTSYQDPHRDGFERYISLAGFFNFGFTLQSGWEVVGLSLAVPLLYGGPVSMVWGTILCAVGHFFTSLSLAEMASMDPTVGAQYRWSARFARSSPEFWGFIQGWITTFAWLVAPSGGLAFVASQTQSIISFYNESYVPTGWQTALLMWAYLLAAIITNLYFRKILNVFETAGGVCHVLFFIACIAILTTLAERSSASFVSTTLTTGRTGWANPGVNFHLGILSALISLSGYDSMLHMIDETRKPRERVPPAMVTAVASNAVLLLGYMITLLFCIGDEELVSGSFSPLLQIYYLATKSKAGSTFILVMHMWMQIISVFNTIASTSRLVWAFAKDDGLPYASFFTPVNKRLRIPIRALALVVVVQIILSLIKLGSSVALTTILSISTVGLIASYIPPVGLLIIRKLKGEHPRYGPFKLGRWGLPCNLLAFCFCSYGTFWAAFPSSRPVTTVNMNYSGPVFIGLIFLCIGDWYISGRKRFSVPTGKYLIEMQDHRQEVEMK